MLSVRCSDEHGRNLRLRVIMLVMGNLLLLLVLLGVWLGVAILGYRAARLDISDEKYAEQIKGLPW